MFFGEELLNFVKWLELVKFIVVGVVIVVI